MSELNGIISTKGSLKGTINSKVKTNGTVSVGGTLITSNLSKKGDKGDDGYSPTATVTKVGDTATITITDKNGTTTATVTDGSAGASAFIAVFGMTSYADIKDAFDADSMMICAADDNGNTVIFQLAYFDATNEVFYFTEANAGGYWWASISNADGWDSGSFDFASTDTATTSTDGLMSYSDKDKLDNIESGAEANVQSNWSQSDNSKDDYIKNKPTIPSKTSDLLNDSNFLHGNTKGSFYGTCSTAASTAAKEVTISGFTSSDRVIGAVVYVMMGHTNTAAVADLTLNVSSTGAKSIKYINNGSLENLPSAGYLETPNVYPFYFDGDYWICMFNSTPTIHDVPSGGTSGQVLAKASGTDYDVEWANQSGGAKNVWYGTCSTAYGTAQKDVTTDADFALASGVVLFVKFDNYNIQPSPSLSVNGGTAKDIKEHGSSGPMTQDWQSGETVGFVYDGTYWQLLAKTTATTGYYGITKLSDSTSSSSSTTAATSKAVKAAYDNCGVTDVTLDGSSVVTSGVAALTSPTVPSKTSDLVNDSLFARGHVACFHGTSSTAAGTGEKAVTCADFKSADLVAGAIIVVSFSNANSAAVADLCLNVNSTGAYHIKYNNAGTLSNLGDKSYLKASAYMFYFDGTYWVLAGYDTNTNTIGYTVRHNGSSLPMKNAMYRYRIMFTSADGEKYVSANASSSTSATASKTVTTEKIDPFGEILYYSTTTAVSAGSRPAAANCLQQYNGITLGYSFNRTGAALTMTAWKPVYIKCAPQADGSAIIDADNPFVQALPSTADGKIYIFLGIATAETSIEMTLNHPVYYYKDSAIRLWTNPSAAATGISDVQVDGTSVVSGGVASIDLTGKADASHTHTKSDITDFPTIPAGTVTSVRVQATSPVQSSVNTAQSSSLDTTISLANEYGDTKNPYGSKTKNYVLAAPSSAAGTPSFRALVSDDIPDLSGTYLTAETDPVFSASAAAGITSTDISNWNNGKLSLDTTAAAGTTDGDLYAAIVALGWSSDVIE